MSQELIARLNDEADLCANEGAFDITHLLLEASREIEQQAAEIERLRAVLREADNALDDYLDRLEKQGAAMNYGRSVLAQIAAALAEQK